MEAVFLALWPEELVPDNFFDLAVHIQDAALRIVEWKSSAAREGARQAWVTLKVHYPGLNLDAITTANPKGPDGNGILPKSFFDAIMKFSRLTEQDYTLRRVRACSVARPLPASANPRSELARTARLEEADFSDWSGIHVQKIGAAVLAIPGIGNPAVGIIYEQMPPLSALPIR